MVSINYPFIILFDIICYTLCNDGVCYTKIQGSPELFCCDNFEMRERMCVECRPGYTSSNNKSCLPCPAHYYGKRCADRCACTEAERCDHVKGCVNGSSPVNNTTDIEDTSKKPSRQTTDNYKHSGSNHHIVVYIVCAGVLFLLLIVCAVCMQKKETMTSIISRNAKKTSDTEKGIILTFKNVENCDSAYDIIDEHYVFSNVLQSVSV